MIEAITASNTGLDASQDQINTASNNLANLNTTSFKANRTLFQDLLYTTLQQSTQLGRGVSLSSTDKLFGEGPLANTGNSLDVAFDGNGFFQVKLPDGSTAYTRNGTFLVNVDGQLVTSDGFLLQPPIRVPTNYTAISIATDGTVSVTTPSSPNTFQKVGQLTLTRFANPPGLTSIGNTLYAVSPASGSPVTGSVPGQSGSGLLRQGFLESSNVDPNTELTNLLIAQQTFSANSQAIVVANDMLLTTAELVALA